MEVSGQLHAPDRFTPRERAPGTHWIGGSLGPRARLEGVVKKVSNPWESNPGHPTAQPVASRYIDWAIPALYNLTQYA
jgi:hypothetical protein